MKCILNGFHIPDVSAVLRFISVFWASLVTNFVPCLHDCIAIFADGIPRQDEGSKSHGDYGSPVQTEEQFTFINNNTVKPCTIIQLNQPWVYC